MDEIAILLKAHDEATQPLRELQDQMRAMVDESVRNGASLKEQSQALDNVGASASAASKDGMAQLRSQIGALLQDSEKIKKVGRDLMGAGKDFSLALTTPIAGITTALMFGAKQLGNYADAVLDTAAQTGLATDQIQAFEAVAIEAGVATDTLANAARAMVQRFDVAGEESARFERNIAAIGIETRTATGELRTMDEMMPEIIRKLSDVENQSERNAIAAGLFGRSVGDQLIPVLELGADAFEEIMEAALASGQVMSRDALEQANQFRIGMETLTREIKLAGREIILEFLPILMDGVGFIRNNVIPSLKAFIDNIVGLIRWYNNLSGPAQAFIASLIAIAAGIGPVLIGVGKFLTMVPTLLIGIKSLGAAFGPLIGPAGILAATALGYKLLNDAINATIQGPARAMIEQTDQMISAHENYRQSLAITSEAERAEAVNRLNAQRRMTEVSLQLTEQRIAQLEAEVIAFANSPIWKQLFNFMSANQALDELDAAREGVRRLRGELSSINTNIEKVSTAPLVSSFTRTSTAAKELGDSVGGVNQALKGTKEILEEAEESLQKGIGRLESFVNQGLVPVQDALSQLNPLAEELRNNLRLAFEAEDWAEYDRLVEQLEAVEALVGRIKLDIGKVGPSRREQWSREDYQDSRTAGLRIDDHRQKMEQVALGMALLNNVVGSYGATVDNITQAQRKANAEASDFSTTLIKLNTQAQRVNETARRLQERELREVEKGVYEFSTALSNLNGISQEAADSQRGLARGAEILHNNQVRQNRERAESYRRLQEGISQAEASLERVTSAFGGIEGPITAATILDPIAKSLAEANTAANDFTTTLTRLSNTSKRIYEGGLLREERKRAEEVMKVTPKLEVKDLEKLSAVFTQQAQAVEGLRGELETLTSTSGRLMPAFNRNVTEVAEAFTKLEAKLLDAVLAGKISREQYGQLSSELAEASAKTLQYAVTLDALQATTFALSNALKLLETDWSNGNEIIATVTDVTASFLEMIPKIGPALAAAVRMVGAFINAIIGDLSNGLRQIDAQVKQTAANSRLLGEELVRGIAEANTQQVSRGGLAGLLGFTKAQLDQEAYQFGLDIATNIANAAMAGILGGEDAFLSSFQQMFERIVAEAIVQSEIMQRHIAEITRLIQEGGNAEAIRQARDRMLEDLRRLRQEAIDAGLISLPEIPSTPDAPETPRLPTPTTGPEVNFGRLPPAVQFAVATPLVEAANRMLEASRNFSAGGGMSEPVAQFGIHVDRFGEYVAMMGNRSGTRALRY